MDIFTRIQTDGLKPSSMSFKSLKERVAIAAKSASELDRLGSPLTKVSHHAAQLEGIQFDAIKDIIIPRGFPDINESTGVSSFDEALMLSKGLGTVAVAILNQLETIEGASTTSLNPNRIPVMMRELKDYRVMTIPRDLSAEEYFGNRRKIGKIALKLREESAIYSGIRLANESFSEAKRLLGRRNDQVSGHQAKVIEDSLASWTEAVALMTKQIQARLDRLNLMKSLVRSYL